MSVSIMVRESAAIPTELFHNVVTLRDAQKSAHPMGFVETTLPSVRLFWADGPVARAPLSYTPGIAIIVSGQKVGYFEDKQITYGPGQYLAVGLPLYFECETHASVEEPLVGIFLSMETQDLHRLSQDMALQDLPRLQAQPSLGIEPLAMTAPLREAVTRLSGQLLAPAQAAVLGPATVREVFFHALQDRHGRVLASQAHVSRPEARIARLLRDLERDRDAFLGVPELASAAGMSPATFHRHFKAVTGASPLQYQKRKRLMRGKRMLLFEGVSVAEAASAVGYASSAQFSRDFNAYFGTPPSRAHLAPYPI
ncbi:MAG: AraC family transcriptional regulator [Pseudomonadota bacterium]